MEFEWLFNPVIEIISKILSNFLADILDSGIVLIVNFIKTPTDINTYLPVGTYISYIQIVAGALLALRVAWEVFGQLSGNIPEAENRSIGRIFLQVLWAGVLIFFLPILVTDILVRINNYTMDLISSITGSSIDVGALKSILITTTSMFGLVLALIWGVGFLLLAVAGAIRYIELIIAILLAPLAALSVVRGNNALTTWTADTVAIVFTQSIHVLLLQFLIIIITNTAGIMMYFLSFAVMSIILRGPQVLRKYIYSTGTGGKVLPVVGGIGRMATVIIRK